MVRMQILMRPINDEIFSRLHPVLIQKYDSKIRGLHKKGVICFNLCIIASPYFFSMPSKLQLAVAFLLFVIDF